MAVNKKGSRNITVSGHDFKWRATGSDELISIVLWPQKNENSRVVASIGYHNEMKQTEEGCFVSQSQVLVTNRMIRELILHVGVEKILNHHGQLNVGRIEDIYPVSNALRG